MKRKKEGIWLAVLVFLVSFSFFLMIRGTEQESIGATAIGTVQVPGMLNVRSGPGTSYELVRSGGTGVTLTDGAKVTITGKNGKWYHVKFTQNGKNIVGYVSSDYVKVLTGSVRTKVYGVVNADSVKIRSKGIYLSFFQSYAPSSVDFHAGDLLFGSKFKPTLLSLVITVLHFKPVLYGTKTQFGYFLCSARRLAV